MNNNQLISLCLLGQKGLYALKSVEPFLSRLKFTVEIGRDSNVQSDYSTEIEAFCIKKSIPYCFRNKDNIQDHDRSDLVIAVGWRWLINNISEDKLIVFHDSLLPKYRGFAPLVNALLNKESKVGVTALLAKCDYDVGPIVTQKSHNVNYPTTIGKEILRISELYQSVMFDVLTLFTSYDFAPKEQIEENATYSLWRDEEDYRINWCDSAVDILHFTNCVGFPYWGASTKVDSTILRVVEAELIPDVKIENRTPGKVIFYKKGMPCVVCGEGILMLKRLLDSYGAEYKLEKFRTRFK